MLTHTPRMIEQARGQGSRTPAPGALGPHPVHLLLAGCQNLLATTMCARHWLLLHSLLAGNIDVQQGRCQLFLIQQPCYTHLEPGYSTEEGEAKVLVLYSRPTAIVLVQQPCSTCNMLTLNQGTALKTDKAQVFKQAMFQMTPFSLTTSALPHM